MRRRDFLGALGGAATVWPLAARSQPGERARHIGVLMTLGPDDPQGEARFHALRDGLRDLGWTEGRNLRIDYRAERDASRISIYAQELLALNPEVIVAAAPPSVVALKRLTQTVPVVFAQVPDPVQLGLVSSLARPGMNVTGFTLFDFPIAGKWLELLKELSPQLAHAVALHYPDSPTQSQYIAAAMAAGRSLGIRVTELMVRDAASIETAIKAAAKEAKAGLIVPPSPLTSAHRALIARLANQHRLPAIYPYRYFVTSGGLASYGVDNVESFRRAASYVDRILKGEKAADLPVQSPTKFELVINLKTATALGLTVPPKLLFTADEVIE